MTLRWTKEMVRTHQEKIHGKNYDNGADQSSIVERRANNVVQKEAKAKNHLPRVDILLTHHRRRLLDIDNFCTKWFIDGLVKIGVLHNDSPKEVRRVTHEQVNIEGWEEERIVIEITEAK